MKFLQVTVFILAVSTVIQSYDIANCNDDLDCPNGDQWCELGVCVEAFGGAGGRGSKHQKLQKQRPNRDGLQNYSSGGDKPNYPVCTENSDCPGFLNFCILKLCFY